MSPEARMLLESGTEELLGTALPSAAVDKLGDYLDELLDWNSRMNLVGPVDDVGAVSRHILDSLAGLPVLTAAVGLGSHVADIGSGAGLPGIPLAIAAPELSMTLVERSTKKCGFLRHAVDLLGLSEIRVVDRDIREIRDQFDALTLRAVSRLDAAFLELIERHLRPGGSALLYKGRRSVIDDELRHAGARRAVVHRVSVPFLDAERHLVVISFA